MYLGEARRSQKANLQEPVEGGEELVGKQLSMSGKKPVEVVEMGGEGDFQKSGVERFGASQGQQFEYGKSAELGGSYGKQLEGVMQSDAMRLKQDSRFRKIEPVFVHLKPLSTKEEEDWAQSNWLDFWEYRKLHLNHLRKIEECEACRPLNETSARISAFLSENLRLAFAKARNIRPTWVSDSEKDDRILKARYLLPMLGKQHHVRHFPTVEAVEPQIPRSRPITDRMDTEIEEKMDSFYPILTDSGSKQTGISDTTKSDVGAAKYQARDPETVQESETVLASQSLQDPSNPSQTVFESELAPTGRSGAINIRHGEAPPMIDEIAQDPVSTATLPSDTTSKSKYQSASKPAGRR